MSNELKAAAERWRNGDEHYNLSFSAQMDETALSAWAVKMLDDTPLTKDAFLRLGFTQIAGAREGELELGDLQVSPEFIDWTGKLRFVVCRGGKFFPIQPHPRTLGELRMLCWRLGIEITE